MKAIINRITLIMCFFDVWFEYKQALYFQYTMYIEEPGPLQKTNQASEYQ